MRRIMIIGSGGAGKSTLARKLGQHLGIPVVHLDALIGNIVLQNPAQVTNFLNQTLAAQ